MLYCHCNTKVANIILFFWQMCLLGSGHHLKKAFLWKERKVSLKMFPYIQEFATPRDLQRLLPFRIHIVMGCLPTPDLHIAHCYLPS